MKMVWFSRRTFIALVAVIVLGLLGYFKGLDVAVSIAMIATGFAGANAYEGRGYPAAVPNQRVDSASAKPANPETPL